MLEQAMWGRSERERAAFVIRSAEGTLSVQPWPYTAAVMEASVASLPQGVVAILHTHPNHRRNPSPEDADVAHRLGIPVYVITRSSIRFTTGSGVQSVWHGDWNPVAPRAQTSCH